MDLLLGIGSACSLVVAIFTVGMLLLGAWAAISPDWFADMAAAARAEVARRGLANAVLSDADDTARRELLRLHHPTSGSNPTLHMTIMHALIDASDDDLERLQQRRAAVLSAAVAAQQRAVRNVARLSSAVRIWKVRHALSLTRAVLVGLGWFGPLFFSRARRIGERSLATATLLGAWAGLLAWGIASGALAGQSSLDGMAWLTIIGAVVTFSTIVGLVTAIGVQAYRAARAVWGPPATWTRRGILTAVVGFVVYGVFAALLMTGTLQRGVDAATAWIGERLGQWDAGAAAGGVIGGALLVAFLVYVMLYALRSARRRDRRMSDRITDVLVALFLAGIVAAGILAVIDAPKQWMSIVIFAVGVIVVLGGGVFGVARLIEWCRTYRYLRSRGVHVPRYGFRWWALIAWCAVALIALIAGTVVSTPVVLAAHGVVVLFIELATAGLSLLLTVTFIPGAIIAVLYWRRVDTIAARVRMHDAATSAAASSAVASSAAAASAAAASAPPRRKP